MAVVVITGPSGFLGRNLVAALQERGDHELRLLPHTLTVGERRTRLDGADIVFHLAGVNRPEDPAAFVAGNADFTAALCADLQRVDRRPRFVLASSTQAANDSPYGRSKLQAETVVQHWAGLAGAAVEIYRLTNIFGKWCRPFYNSVVATFCHQAAHGLPLTVHDPARELELVYIDDVVGEFLRVVVTPPVPGAHFRSVSGTVRLTLGALAAELSAFRESRISLALPSLSTPFARQLYATYLSHLERPDFAYPLARKTDARGSLAEFIKQEHFGQVFISRTAPGITRGHHYHHTKTEKFFVVEGEAIVRFQHIVTGEQVAHTVRGTDFKVIDIPPGYAHSIENVGPSELVTLFWASEVFDPARPDVHGRNVPAFPPAAP